MSDHERIVLVVNHTLFVGAPDTISALSSFDFTELENIDKIYFETNRGQFTLIFDRSVLQAIKESRDTGDPATAELLLQYLRYQLRNKDNAAFDFVRRVTESSGDISWLSDKNARENLVRFGEELIAKGLLKDAMWIIRQLHNDPDPDPSGETDRHHLLIFQGEEAGVITTVRGHFCWLMARMVVQNKPEYYTEIITVIGRYVTEQNLYIRKQVAVPLGELVARRRAVRNLDGSPFDWKGDERELAKALAFTMLRQNVNYPRVLEALLPVFVQLRDLNEAEAEEVLLVFIARNEDYIVRNLAALVVYFALFREKHFPDKGAFHNERFLDILKRQIASGTPAMRSSLAWHFWKIIHDNLLPYETIRQLLFLFWAGKYDAGVASMFSSILDELVKVAPDDATEIFGRMVSYLKDEIKAHPERASLYWGAGTEKVIPLLAKDPDVLLATVKELQEIWMGGVVIGDVKTIFESYRLANSEQKARIMEEFSLRAWVGPS